MKLMLAAVALAATLILPAYAQNLAVVNGKPVPTARLNALVQQVERGGGTVDDSVRAQLREEAIMREIFAQEADRRGLRARPEFRAQAELALQTLLIRELFADFQRKNPVTAAQVKAEYDKFAAANQGQEFRVRHILVETEAEARAILTQIRAGANFEELARTRSRDPGSAPQGGDLDWAGVDVFVPEFSQAMVKLGKGQLSPEPVRTQFGWHLIRVDDVRRAQLPPLEQLQPQIEQNLMQQRLMAFQEELRGRARIR